MQQDHTNFDSYRLNTSRRVLAGLILLGTVVVLVSLYFVDPSHGHVFPPCPFYSATGLFCPGCGSARCLYQLLHGHLCCAVRYNPLAIAVLPVLAYGGLSEISVVVRARKLSSLPGSAQIDWVIFGIIVMYWVVRNIPAYPFNLLAPCG